VFSSNFCRSLPGQPKYSQANTSGNRSGGERRDIRISGFHARPLPLSQLSVTASYFQDICFDAVRICSRMFAAGLKPTVLAPRRLGSVGSIRALSLILPAVERGSAQMARTRYPADRLVKYCPLERRDEFKPLMKLPLTRSLKDTTRALKLRDFCINS